MIQFHVFGKAARTVAGIPEESKLYPFSRRSLHNVGNLIIWYIVYHAFNSQTDPYIVLIVVLEYLTSNVKIFIAYPNILTFSKEYERMLQNCIVDCWLIWNRIFHKQICCVNLLHKRGAKLWQNSDSLLGVAVWLHISEPITEPSWDQWNFVNHVWCWFQDQNVLQKTCSVSASWREMFEITVTREYLSW